MLKMMKRWRNRPSTRIGEDNPFFKLGMALEKLKALNDNLYADRTKTANPRGKIGKLEYVFNWERTFKDGNRKWAFRKFGKKTFEDADGFIKALKKRGFEELGSGAFSTVLAKPGQNRVIKVIRRPDGWMNYIMWASQEGQAGKLAPKVYSYKKIKGRKRDFEVAVMERLKSTIGDIGFEHNFKMVPALMWFADRNPLAGHMLDNIVPGLLDYVKKMSAKWDIPIQNFDFHEGNIMLREDGSFVIVDPVSRGHTDFPRLKAGDFGPLPAFTVPKLPRAA